MLFRSLNVENIELERDHSVRPTTETIRWRQTSRCGFFSKCSEEYLLVDYYPNGNKRNNVFKVFVARSVFRSPPDRFYTSGYHGKLHFGFLHFGGANEALFFVLHNNDMGPYQHRFKTNTFTNFFKVCFIFSQNQP